MRAFIKIIWIFFVLSPTILAQLSSNLEVGSAYDDNMFRSLDPVEDVISDLSLDLGYRFNNSNLNIYYNGNFVFFRNFKERNLSLHRLGLSHFISFGKEDFHTFFWGVNGLTRIDREEYQEYDYNQLYFYANVRFDLESLFIKSGYNFRYRDYVNFSELTNLRHYFFLQFNKSFATRTTMILEADLGYKAFTTLTPYTTFGESTPNGGGNGHSSGIPINSFYPATLSSSVPPMGQIILLGRVAQSVFENLGIYIQYRKQINLSDQIKSITGTNYYQDEELFDDPFSFEDQEISSQLSWIMPWEMRLEIGGSYFDKSYLNDMAFTSINDTVGSGGQRIDQQKTLFINFKKTFIMNKNWLDVLQFNFYYGYTNNKSNSIWYNFTNRILGGGIQWRL